MKKCRICKHGFTCEMVFGTEDKNLKDCMPEDWNGICLNCVNRLLINASHKHIIWIAKEFEDYRTEEK